MVWQNPKEPSAVGLAGPKTLRSNLVVGEGRKVEVKDLETLELLGQGAYGQVHKVQERATGQCRVLKTVVRPDGWDDDKLKLEAELLRHLDHPHILRIFNWYEDGDAINIVLEHCEGGEVLKVVKAGRRQGIVVAEKWLATAVRQTFEALVYLHSKGVVHKDLKGQNLLLLHQLATDDLVHLFQTMPHIVICDLGIAEVCCRGIFGLRGRRVAGTPCTMAPEVWRGTCGPRSDVWSMGCVMFELFTNKLPFEVLGGVKAARQQERWAEQHRRGPNWALMERSPQAQNLCRALLTYKEAQRPSASDCLKHPWFSICEDDDVLSEREITALCQAMLSYRKRNPMQRALCLKMAVGSPAISRFARIFTKFDKDHSGILDHTEVISALRALGIDKSTAKKAASALDVNGDNSCEYIEFVSACLFSLEGQFDELLRQEFKALDRKQKGELTDEEFQLLIEELKPIAESRGLQLESIDADGDGRVSFDEFCSYFGRPWVAYNNRQPGENTQQLPMKQHIRIMHSRSNMEESMELLAKASMDQRGGGRGSAKAQKALTVPLEDASELPSEPNSGNSGGEDEWSRQASSDTEGVSQSQRLSPRSGAIKASSTSTTLASPETTSGGPEPAKASTPSTACSAGRRSSGVASVCSEGREAPASDSEAAAAVGHQRSRCSRASTNRRSSLAPPEAKLCAAAREDVSGLVCGSGPAAPGGGRGSASGCLPEPAHRPDQLEGADSDSDSSSCVTERGRSRSSTSSPVRPERPAQPCGSRSPCLLRSRDPQGKPPAPLHLDIAHDELVVLKPHHASQDEREVPPCVGCVPLTAIEWLQLLFAGDHRGGLEPEKTPASSPESCAEPAPTCHCVVSM